MRRVTSNRAGYLFALSLILFIAFAFRLWNLGTQSLWHDEAWSVFSAYHPLAWGMLGTDPNAPPVFYLSLGAWMQFLGDGVWALRFWSLLFGVLTVAVVALLTRRWFGDHAALLAAFLTAINPILWVFSQEIRAYVVMPLGALLLLGLMDQILVNGSRRAWLWLAVVELLTLYAQNLAVPIVAWLNVSMVLALLIPRKPGRLVRWLLLQAVLGIAYLPWLLTQKPTGTPLNTTPPIDLTLLGKIWQSYFTGIQTLINADQYLTLLLLIFALVALIGLIAALTLRRSRWLWLLLSQVLFIPIFETAIIYAAHIDFHPRYYIVGVPATLILIAVGWTALTQTKRNGIIPMVRRLAVAGVALLAVLITVRMGWVTFRSSVFQHDDFRTIAQSLAQLGPDDAIIIPYGWEPTLDYYSRKMAFKARFINIPLYSSGDTILNTLQKELPTVKRAAFLTWYQLPADVRGAYPCLLRAFGQPGDSLTVQGLKLAEYHYFYVRKTLVQIPPTGSLRFGPFTLRELHPFDNVDGVCLMTTWTLDQPTAQDYQLRMGVSADPMNLMGQNNTGMLDDHQYPTHRWNVGNEVRAFSWVDLPAGIPQYVQMRALFKLYSAGEPLGVDIQRCERLTGTNCTPVSVGRQTEIYFQKTLDPVPVFTRLDSDKLIGTGVYLRRAYPLPNMLRQGECVPLMAEVWWENGLASFMVGYVISDEIKPIRLPNDQPRVLVYTQFCVPLDQSSPVEVGLVLLGANGRPITPVQPLGTIPIQPVKRVFEKPDIPGMVPTDANFLALAILKGAKVPETVTAGAPFDVTLLWLTQRQTYMRERVFVQLLNSEGQVIAQHDGEPANGARPTFIFAQDEYLTDTHTLTWNRTDYKGSARLIVGFYNIESLARALTNANIDYYELPITVQVQ